MYYGNGNTENNSCSVESNMLGSYIRLLNKYGDPPYKKPVEPLGFYKPITKPHRKPSYWSNQEMMPLENFITNENINLPVPNISNEFDSVIGAEFPNEPKISDIPARIEHNSRIENEYPNFPHSYYFLPPPLISGFYEPTATFINQEMMPLENVITSENINLPVPKISNEFDSVIEAESPNEQNISDIPARIEHNSKIENEYPNFPLSYHFLPPSLISGFYDQEMMPLENVIGAESPNEPNILDFPARIEHSSRIENEYPNFHFPDSYLFQPPFLSLDFYEPTDTFFNQPTYYETSLFVTAGETIHNKETYNLAEVGSIQAVTDENVVHDAEKYVQFSKENILYMNNYIPYGMPKTTFDLAGQLDGLNISGTKETQLKSGGVVEVKPKKKKNRSAKKIERARRWRERQYTYDYIWNNADKVGSNSSFLNKNENIPCATPEVDQYWMNTKPTEPNSILEGQSDFDVRCEKLPERKTIDSKRNIKLRATAKEFVPFIENEILPQEDNYEVIIPGHHTLLPEYGDQSMYTILAIYTNSGIHGEIDLTVESDEKTSRDGEDFGYEYFSLNNLCL